MSQITLLAPAPVATPRGAEWAANAFAALLRLFEPPSEADVERRLRRQRAEEAAGLRRVAAGISKVDPALAADLYAAADRHLAA
ncbi:MAG: hypothetical protein KIT17_04025 [Rubrivivax sp.]|nr:hypothetical protein [Rubrivivax sp.]